MSQLKVNTIRHTGASSDAVTLASDGTCTANITNPRSFRNLIINGACLVNQHSNASAVTSGYPIDRVHIEGFTGGGTGTGQQVSDGPSGFIKSLKVTVTGTDTSLAASDYYTLRHIIEGQNVAFLGFGASGGTSVTLSFWVKSSVTGTFCASLGNGSNNRTMPKEYSISSANTWEKKSLTFPADTTGTWGTDEGRGFSVRWCMGVGSARTGTADTYNASEAHGTSNQTNLFATNGATFQITGLQLEAGSIATDFEHKKYADELQHCKRYYQSLGSGSNVVIRNAIKNNGDRIMGPLLPVSMRATPTCTSAANLVEFSSGTNRSVSSFESIHNEGGGYIQLGAAITNGVYWLVQYSAEL